MPFPASVDENVQVLVVGGGGAGLTSSMLLAVQGVDHLLVSARPGTSDLPKAHVLNQRAMEVLDDVGVAEAIEQRSTPAEQMAATAFYAGFAGPEADYGRRLARLESWGAGGADENWRAASPLRQLNLPQIRLEPLLKARAEELSPGRIRFGHELIDLEQDDDGVRALIRDSASGREYVVRSDYLLGADGGRRVAGLIGVDYEGLGVVTDTATLHVSADFSRLAKDPEVLIRWIFSPQAGVLVVMVPMGPERWGPRSEEWVIHLNYPVDDPRAQSDAQIEADARKSLGIGDVPLDVHKVTRWSVEAVMASAFRVGRVFLVGDAAHRHPPTGGLGLTSAIHDAQNLSWKLAAVLAGYASPALLDTYEVERRGVDQRNCQRSLENAINHFAIGAELGISPDNPAEQNMQLLRRMWSDRSEDAAHRSSVQRAMRAQSMEFNELNVEYGYAYDSAAIVPDGTAAAVPVDDIRVYEPTTRPGRAAAACVARRRGRQSSGRQGPRQAGAVSPHRRRGRPCVVRGRPRARRGGGHSARRGADRPSGRRPLRPALRLVAASPDRRRRRSSRATRSIRCLASANGRRRSSERTRQRAAADPRAPGRGRRRVRRLSQGVVRSHVSDRRI